MNSVLNGATLSRVDRVATGIRLREARDASAEAPDTRGGQVLSRDSRQVNDLACGSSIPRFGRFCKLLIGSALGAGSPHWTISATG